jgi:hypothetical protein
MASILSYLVNEVVQESHDASILFFAVGNEYISR